MNTTRLLLLLALVGLPLYLWNHRAAHVGVDATIASPNGFVSLPAPTNVDGNKVIVFAAANCPKEAAQRADRLASDLADRNIPSARASSANFDLADPNPKLVKRLDAVMRGPLPIVFVRGKAKANPTLDQVLAEYELSEH